jgi:hypothetical protein
MSHVLPTDLSITTTADHLTVHADLAFDGPDLPKYVQLLGRVEGKGSTSPSTRERVTGSIPTHLSVGLPRDDGSPRCLDLWIVEARRAEGPGTPTWQARFTVSRDAEGQARLERLSGWTICPSGRQPAHPLPSTGRTALH